jgi:hypothetical protein
MRAVRCVVTVLAALLLVAAEPEPVSAPAQPELEPAAALALAEILCAEAEALLKNAQPRLAGERLGAADHRLAQIPKAERPNLGERYKAVRARLTAVARTLADDPALIPPEPPPAKP